MIDQQLDAKILAWTQANREQILNQWMDLVRIPSISGSTPVTPKAPNGIACAEALNTAAGYFAQQGLQTKVYDEDGYALASYGDGDRIIGLFGHSDVVPVGDGWLYTSPFEPVIQEGTLIGRGASDNKSGVMASLCVMSILRECGIRLGSRLQTFIGSDEEVGMKDITAFVKSQPMPDVSLVPDSQFACSLGEKGILRSWVECQTPLKMIQNFRGGNAFNVVLDHVEVTLNASAELESQLRAAIGTDPAYTLTVLSDGSLKLTADGIAKHAASPAGSINATVLAAKLLAGCSALDVSDRKTLETVYTRMESYFGEGMGIAMEDPHFTRLTSANGMVAVEDGKLRISIDIRYPASLPGAKLEEKLYKLWDSQDWKIVYMYNREGFEESPDGMVPNTMLQVYADVTGVEAKTYYMPGGTYARYLKNAYAVGTVAEIPNRSQQPMVFPEGHGRAHQKDEGINIDGFFQAVRVLTHAVIALDRQLCSQND